MHLIHSRCLSQKMYFFFCSVSPLSLCLPSTFSPPSPFIFYLSILLPHAVCCLSVDGPLPERHPLGGAGCGFAAAWAKCL